MADKENPVAHWAPSGHGVYHKRVSARAGAQNGLQDASGLGPLDVGGANSSSALTWTPYKDPECKSPEASNSTVSR